MWSDVMWDSIDIKMKYNFDSQYNYNWTSVPVYQSAVYHPDCDT